MRTACRWAVVACGLPLLLVLSTPRVGEAKPVATPDVLPEAAARLGVGFPRHLLPAPTVGATPSQGTARATATASSEAHLTTASTTTAPRVDRLPEDAPRRARVVAAAQRLLRAGTSFRDCSSFVQRVFRAAGETVTPVPLPRGRSLSESLFRASVEVDLPRPGDIAVFHDTYDANRDGKRNDRFTHVSLVESVEGDVVTLIHRGGRGLARHRMNLSAPDDPATNDPLRRRPKGSRMRVLSGQLFAGYGDLLGPP